MPFAYSVKMNDGSTYTVKRLLSAGDDNFKTNKSDLAGRGISTYSLSLAPASTSGFNVCASASPGCISGCIFTSGNAMLFPRTILPARIAKTILYKTKPSIFMDRLITEIKWAERLTSRKGNRLYVRLNVFSDIMWERETDIIERFPNVQFYDYTAHYVRMFKYLISRKDKDYTLFPANYHLTFSRKENNWTKCEEILIKGGNVAVPFHIKGNSGRQKAQPLPRYWNGFKVLDGDLTDLRPLDPQNGYIIGLRAKGKARKDHTSGFIVMPSAPIQIGG
jgi:hypothetical protein